MTRKSNKMDFQNHWLDYTVEGQALREWCRCLKTDAGKALCIYCNVSVKFGVNPVMSFKKHALSRRHKQNRKKVQLGLKQTVDDSIKQMKPKQAIDTCSVLYPGMNFNCSVNLLPLSVLHKTSNQGRNSDLVSLLKLLVRPGIKDFIDVYICFHCGAEFATKSTLQNHQGSCSLRSPELQVVTPMENAQMFRHHGYLTPPRSSAFFNTSGFNISRNFGSTRDQVRYPSVWQSKDSFITSLGLLPKKKAAQACIQRRNTQCENIDLDDDIPISPTLPRTPKLLISHLSRDGSEKCGENSPSHVRKSLFCLQHNQTDEEANSSKGNDDNSELNKSEERSKISHAKSLYSLDLTSPLGQFVIKHIKGDPNLHVLSDVESHCLTLTPQVSTPAIKLRDRHVTYPITFKGFSGKCHSSHIHLYKFTRRQKVEFLQRVNTGLDKNSRALLRKMKMCKVTLAHLTRCDLRRWMVSSIDVTVDLKPLSAEEILFWTSPKETIDTNCNNAAVFAQGLSFSSPDVNNVLGLKTCQDGGLCSKYHLSVANYVSEEACAEVTENRRTVYKSLLSDCTNGLISETDSSPASLSVLRLALNSPALYTRHDRQVNFSQDFPNSKVNMASVCTPLTLSPALSSSKEQSIMKERMQHCNLLSPVDINTDYGRCTRVNLFPLSSGTLDGRLDPAVSSVSGDKTGKLATMRAVLPGTNSVYMRTALEGEAIENSATNYQKVCNGYKGSVKFTRTEQGTDRNQLANSKLLMKSFVTIKQPSVKNTAKKRGLKRNDYVKAKRRKVSKVSSLAENSHKRESSLTETGRINGQDISLGKYSESRNKHAILPAHSTRTGSAVKNVNQRLSMHSAYPCSEKQQNPPHFLKAGSAQNRLEPYNCGVSNQGVSHQIKQHENSKCSGCYGKRITVASFLNGNVENCHRCIVCPHADSSLGLKKLHHNLKVKNGKHMLSSKFNKHSSKGTETNLTVKKPRYISRLCSSDEIERTNRIESRSTVSPSINSINKAVKVAKKSLLPVNASLESAKSPQKDGSFNGLRFVSYSSPSSPQLRQSSLITTISIPRKAEVRKSLLSSFLLKSK